MLSFSGVSVSLKISVSLKQVKNIDLEGVLKRDAFN